MPFAEPWRVWPAAAWNPWLPLEFGLNTEMLNEWQTRKPSPLDPLSDVANRKRKGQECLDGAGLWRRELKIMNLRKQRA